MKWNAGWFGGQIGGTCWLLPSGIMYFLYGYYLPGLTTIFSFVAVNLIGTFLWINRSKISAILATNIFLASALLFTSFSFFSMHASGVYPNLNNQGNIFFEPFTKIIYFTLLLFPALAVQLNWIHLKRGS
jgi:multisubunit Na+/H+ antiporter MnhC subunit